MNIFQIVKYKLWNYIIRLVISRHQGWNSRGITWGQPTNLPICSWSLCSWPKRYVTQIKRYLKRYLKAVKRIGVLIFASGLNHNSNTWNQIPFRFEGKTVSQRNISFINTPIVLWLFECSSGKGWISPARKATSLL